jgi:hypothetical protein
MGWFIVEALAALAIGVFIVWWTMFSGRIPQDDDGADAPGPPPERTPPP